MLPSARSIEDSRQGFADRRRTRVPAWRSGLVIAAIVLVGSAAWGVVNGRESADSGWAVGTPATAILEAELPEPKMQNILHDVLAQSPSLVLRDGGPKLLHSEVSTLRFAERPSHGAWRTGGPDMSPQTNEAIARSKSRPAFSATFPLTLTPPATPRKTPVEAPVAAADEDSEAETGCDGEFAEPKTETSAIPAVPTPPDATSDSETESESKSETVEQPAVDSIAEETDEEAAVETVVTDSPTAEAEAEETASDSVDSKDESPEPKQLGDAMADTTPAPAAPAPVVEKPLPPLTRQLTNLRARVRSVLKGYYRKPLNSRDNDCWEVMHGMLSYGIHSRILQGSSRGEPITAVGWLCYNKPCKGQTLMYITPQAELRAKWGVGLQGHSGQLLAMLAQCHVSPEYPIHVGKIGFTVQDLIEAEKKTCYPKSELTFKLLAFQYYLDLNEKWVNDQGVNWDIPRLIREEIAQPIRGAACGGTHRLSSLSLVVKARQRRDEPVDGEYAEAAAFVEKYQKYAFRLQNRDGSLSTEWFRGRGDEDDLDRRIKTTGHILEWLCYSLDDEELRQPQTIRAVAYLANIMYSNYDHDWEVGPRSHALHALLLYDERVFKPFDKAGEVAIYRPATKTARRSQQHSSSKR